MTKRRPLTREGGGARFEEKEKKSPFPRGFGKRGKEA